MVTSAPKKVNDENIADDMITVSFKHMVFGKEVRIYRTTYSLFWEKKKQIKKNPQISLFSLRLESELKTSPADEACDPGVLRPDAEPRSDSPCFSLRLTVDKTLCPPHVAIIFRPALILRVMQKITDLLLLSTVMKHTGPHAVNYRCDTLDVTQLMPCASVWVRRKWSRCGEMIRRDVVLRRCRLQSLTQSVYHRWRKNRILN